MSPFLPQLIDGTYQGEIAGEMPEIQSFSSSSEVAMLINIPGYVNMMIAMSGLELPPIDAEPVWLEMEVDFVDGGVNKRFRVSGAGLTASQDRRFRYSERCNSRLTEKIM